MTVPDESARMLMFVIARAFAVYSGRKEPTLADQRLAAKLLTQPGSPLDRFEAHQFETHSDAGFDAASMIG
jgi:hypothetical protein